MITVGLSYYIYIYIYILLLYNKNTQNKGIKNYEHIWKIYTELELTPQADEYINFRRHVIPCVRKISQAAFILFVSLLSKHWRALIRNLIRLRNARRLVYPAGRNAIVVYIVADIVHKYYTITGMNINVQETVMWEKWNLSYIHTHTQWYDTLYFKREQHWFKKYSMSPGVSMGCGAFGC